jgi:2-oxoglutarate ferredoxin oxidoreductase subunit beta
MDQMNLREKTVGVAPVGCAVLLYNYLDVDMQEAAHGRAPAMATGIKRVRPECFVFTYQGDGDLASIGMSEIIHAAARGENITVIFINNANYGMTGGQMAPTTLPGQRTATSPAGRDIKTAGYPIRVSELLATLDGPAYIARVSLFKPKEIVKAKKALGFGLGGGPLSPGNLVGVHPAKLDHTFGDGKHGYFVNRMKAAAVNQQIHRK